MSQLSPILRGAEGECLLFWCPGCAEPHMIRHGGGHWTWNGDAARPTFSPSVLVTGFERMTDGEHFRVMRGEQIERRPMRCHSFVTDGRIQFLGDCTHKLRGQTVDLPPWPDGFA